MKIKIFNVLLIFTSFIGYLEWGEDNRMFLIEVEADVLLKLVTDPGSVLHPFILLPLGGQLILLYTLFRKRPKKILTYLGMGGIAVLLLFMFFIGVISLNLKILGSTLPFFIVAVMIFRHYRTQNKI